MGEGLVCACVMCVCGGREAGILHTINTRIEAGDSLALIPGPTQLSVAFSTASDGKLGGD